MGVMSRVDQEERMQSLRQWRAARLLSSKTLAAHTGVSNKTILDIENGKRTPTFRTIQTLSNALGVEPQEVNEFADAIAKRSQMRDSSNKE